MRIKTGKMDYKSALRFKNKLMFNHKGTNPRISKKDNGWVVTYTSKKFIA